jgi:hypothetical protein
VTVAAPPAIVDRCIPDHLPVTARPRHEDLEARYMTSTLTPDIAELPS